MCSPTVAKSSSTRGMSSSKKEPGRTKTKGAKPAFDGAPFDRDGNCVKHKSVQLAEQVKQDGRLLWKEIRTNCPKCQSEHHRSRRVTSLGGAGKVKRGRSVHGMSNPLRDTHKSGRRMDVEFDTPFDDKGRCHHHPHVQMAAKKRGGGWKILTSACPKCIEAKYDEDSESLCSSKASSKYSRGSRRSRGGGRDNDAASDAGSVSSRSTKRSVSSRTRAAVVGAQFDKNGCCTRHPTVQVAKKKLLGGWKELRPCPKCQDPHFDDMADNASVSSRRSERSTTSFRSKGSARSAKSGRSRKSAKSNASRRGGRKTDRYGALPFDEEGYCHNHPSVRLAKKKALGGWKILSDLCPDCAQDALSVAGSSVRSKSSRRSSGTGRYYDGSGSESGSVASGKSGKSGRSAGSRKKKIRVKGMRHRDEHGREGRYSGDVDEDHTPHGQGKMKYKDGSVFAGVWSEGSQVHGKTSKPKKASSSSSSKGPSKGEGGKKSSDWARRDKPDSSSAAAAGAGSGVDQKRKKVRKTKWMDYYGDPGEYTGEVDAANLPHGRGSMKYDHGLVQEGTWAKGRFVEGSDANSTAASARTRKASGKGNGKSSGKSSGKASGSGGWEGSGSVLPKNRSGRSGGGGGGGGGNLEKRVGGGDKRKPSSSSSSRGGTLSSSVRGMDP
ncbi:hypothetical protein ACHAWF_011725 [Thalassiosira exigua]